ncbi:MAG: hypothetical protein LBS84_00550 [Clostridiales bacterium]|nr:hypothetical protein [Clostridiales bacterium]
MYFSVLDGEVDIEEAEKEADAIIEGYPSMDVSLSDSVTLRLIGRTEKVNIPAVIEGRDLSAPGEILLDPAFALANNIPLGGGINIAGKTYSVAGYMGLPKYIYPLRGINDLVAIPASFGVGVINPGDFAQFDSVDQNYSVKFNDHAISLNEQMTRLREYLQNNGVLLSDWTAAPNNKRMAIVDTSVSSYQAMSMPISLSMILLSCLIIGIMTWRMIKQESVIIGTFYAFGCRRRELLRHYTAIPMLLALTGGTADALLGVPCVRPAVDAMAQAYIIPVPAILSSVKDILLSILMPVISLGVSSYFVVNAVLKHPAAELMKGGRESGKVGAWERLFKLERFKFNTKFKLREQLRSISRLLFLVIGVVSASALMLFGFFIVGSYTELFKNSTESDYNFEYEYAYH